MAAVRHPATAQDSMFGLRTADGRTLRHAGRVRSVQAGAGVLMRGTAQGTQRAFLGGGPLVGAARFAPDELVCDAATPH